MWSSERLGLARSTLAAMAVSTVFTYASGAGAQQQAQGFAVERLYPSAPGGGWFVMDDLDLRGGLGSAAALTTGYALNPLRVTDGSQHLNVVSSEAFADFGFAVTYFGRWRLYLDLQMPLAVKGQSGVVGGYEFSAPSVDPAENPDILADTRFGLDTLLLGDPQGPWRLGASAQLFINNGERSEYVTDGTVRAMLRLLFAGNKGCFTYAAQLGVHVRPLDDAPTPGSPRGSELLFGIAGGPSLAVGRGALLVVGPEIYGESALNAFLDTTTTGVEALLSGRIEGTADDGPQLRVKLGTGGGIDPHFGAPEWRIVLGVELFDRGGDRDKDGVTDSQDACPDTPGKRTHDPKTNGCPDAASGRPDNR